MGANIVFFSNRFSVELEGREPAFQANRSRILVDSETILDLGKRTLVLNAVESSHSSTDLTVFDGSTGTFWTGDLLFRERLPVVEGSLLSWLAWMKKIEVRPFNRVIPGHGPLDDRWPKSLIPQYRYLDAVRLDVEAAIARGQDIIDVPMKVAEEERADWLLVKGVHENNVYKAYRELEWR
jgi:glyoxylase-like metal-dependent hydrolase (beta-lactamase superfamily II)